MTIGVCELMGGDLEGVNGVEVGGDQNTPALMVTQTANQATIMGNQATMSDGSIACGIGDAKLDHGVPQTARNNRTIQAYDSAAGDGSGLGVLSANSKWNSMNY